MIDLSFRRWFGFCAAFVVISNLNLGGVALAQSEAAHLFEISGSEVRTVEASATKRNYNLYIKLPPGYGAPENADRRYPVVYLNDGGYCWVTAVGITRPAFSFDAYDQAILVGFSYAKGDKATNSRVRDFTPTQAGDWKLETGGADAYLDFMKNDALPLIEGEYRADPNHRVVVGHSLGGLFGAYALIKEPGLFHDYVLISPSLWFDDEAIFALEEQAAEDGTTLSGRIYFAVGDTETPSVNGGPHDMVAQQVAFAERLRSRGHAGLVVRDEILPGGTHLTTFPVGFTHALRWLLPGEDVYNGGSR
ncbi:MAG: alpha/beta hydrolase-fold protein [Pseudomonadota bacterium]